MQGRQDTRGQGAWSAVREWGRDRVEIQRPVLSVGAGGLVAGRGPDSQGGQVCWAKGVLLGPESGSPLPPGQRWQCLGTGQRG